MRVVFTVVPKIARHIKTSLQIGLEIRGGLRYSLSWMKIFSHFSVHKKSLVLLKTLMNGRHLSVVLETIG